MALLSYTNTWGYRRWHAWRAYSSDESPFLESEFAPAALAIPVRPQGVLLWRGEFETPVYAAGDGRWLAVRALMELLDHGVNQLRVPVPADQRRIGVLGASLVVQPMRVDAPVRGSRGETRGWSIAWVEVPP